MELRILGPVAAVVEEGRPPLGAAQQRAVAALLALEAGRAVSRAALVDGIWGNDPPDTAANTLQVYVSQLRKALGREVIRTVGTGYALNAAAVTLDRDRFARLAAEGSRQLERGEAQAAGEALRAALELWRGPALADVAEFPFAQPEIARLEELRLATIEQRIEADLACGRHRELVPELRALVASHPLRERPHGQLMLALYRTGRQVDALQVYRDYRSRLDEELGLEPSATLRRLESDVLRCDPALDSVPEPRAAQALPILAPRSERPPSAGTRSCVRNADVPAVSAVAGRVPAVWNVPPRNPHFVGRAEVLSELRRRLRSGEPALVVQALHGMGGVGKTQLAIEYAHRFAADYELVWWLDTEQPALLAGQLAALTSPLGLTAGDSVVTAAERVRSELRRRSSWLLIFDNAQRPQDLLDYLPDSGGHVLVTSRYPGWGGLGGRLEVDVLPRPETVALLRRRLMPELDEALADELGHRAGRSAAGRCAGRRLSRVHRAPGCGVSAPVSYPASHSARQGRGGRLPGAAGHHVDAVRGPASSRQPRSRAAVAARRLSRPRAHSAAPVHRPCQPAGRAAAKCGR